MLGDKYVVREDCNDGIHWLYKDEILVEREAYNIKTESKEDGGAYNELTHEKYGFICEVGSEFTKAHLEKIS